MAIKTCSMLTSTIHTDIRLAEAPVGVTPGKLPSGPVAWMASSAKESSTSTWLAERKGGGLPGIGDTLRPHNWPRARPGHHVTRGP